MKPIRIIVTPTRNRLLNIFLGLTLSLVALVLLLALVSYHPADPSLDTAAEALGSHAARNWMGIFGAWCADLLLQVFGIASFLLPIWMGGVGWSWMRSRSGGSPLLRWVGTLCAMLFVPTLFALLPWHWRWVHALPVEGVTGRLVSALLVQYLNIQGAWLVSIVLAVAGLYFASSISLWVLFGSLQDRWIGAVSLHDRWRNWREQRAEAREARLASKEIRRKARLHYNKDDDEFEFEDADLPAYQRAGLRQHPRFAEAVAEGATGAPDVAEEEEYEQAPPVIEQPYRPSSQQHEEEPQLRHRQSTWQEAEAGPSAAEQARREAGIELPPEPQPEPPTPIHQAAAPAARSAASAATTAAAASFASAARAASPEGIAIQQRADTTERPVTVAPKNLNGYKLPPSTLLTKSAEAPAIREEELREEARALTEKCAEFDVRGRVEQITLGPMVTTFEFKPEAGIKYSRLTSLDDDLCLAMRAESIRIERTPGKSTVGIQIPNRVRETIHLRDIIESEGFRKAKSRLTLTMGKDINGGIHTTDLAAMPHVLIAGSTGSGKSVAINAMIMSLLFRTTPEQVRLILVDPKRVELGMYEGIPHLFTPIITEPKLAANALRNAVREMERRLKLLASRSVRNIDQYNKLFEGSTRSLFGSADETEQEEPLPYIVIIIDELADLMMLDRANVEESITRLAQMARAVGIHLILATQRPSVDVITGLIKANVPTRISFRLATKVDSRTIIDTNGAEALLGRGDMLFLPPGTSRLVRLHAPYVSEQETAAVVGFWKAQGEADYAEGFLESPREEKTAGEGGTGDEDNDPLYDDALRLVFEFGKASTSLLQRRLRIGYGRAAHLIDMMERDGMVGPADGSRPRELLKSPAWLHEVPEEIE